MSREKRNNRFRIFFYILSVISLILIIRYSIIMIGPDDEANPTQVQLTRTERGPILDRNGHLMAVQTRLYSVTVWTPDVSNPDETALLLSDILAINSEDLYQKLTTPDRFFYIKRKITLAETEEIRTCFEDGKLKGISLEAEAGRHYPEKELASHVLGYVGVDNVGLNGLEYIYNDILLPSEIGRRGQVVYGNQIYLTIDINSQYITEKIAKEAFEEHQPDILMAVVMEAKTGDILSYVSLPSFDPNNYGNYSASERNNRIATYTYEPGSVFKMFSLSSIMNQGGITYNDEFNTTGGYNPELFQENNIPKITDLGSYGTINLQEILIHSSNVGSAYASDTVSRQNFYNQLSLFGFGEPVGLPFNGESHGLFYTPDNWSARTKPTIAFGQEIGVSAIQMVTAATVFANSGLLLEPHIIKRITSSDGTVLQEFNRTPVREVLSADVADSFLNMMEQVVSSDLGTARLARIDGFPISAKSGTAQMLNPETGKYDEEKFIASVMSIFPTDDPQLIVYVVLVNPKGDSYYGGRIVSPIIKDIALQLSPLNNIALPENQVIEHSGSMTVNRPVQLNAGDTIPNFIGLSKREAISFFENSNCQLNYEGNGWVTFQFPPEGETIEDDTIIFLKFE